MVHSFTFSFLSREQPIFTCKAHVFHIDPKTKRSWIPASSSAINVSFFYDSTRTLYRIISVEGTKVNKEFSFFLCSISAPATHLAYVRHRCQLARCSGFLVRPPASSIFCATCPQLQITTAETRASQVHCWNCIDPALRLERVARTQEYW